MARLRAGWISVSFYQPIESDLRPRRARCWNFSSACPGPASAKTAGPECVGRSHMRRLRALPWMLGGIRSSRLEKLYRARTLPLILVQHAALRRCGTLAIDIGALEARVTARHKELCIGKSEALFKSAP